MKHNILIETEVCDLQHPDLALFFGSSESALLHYFEPAPGVFIAESPNVIERALFAGYEPIALLTEAQDAGAVRLAEQMESWLMQQKREQQIPHYVVKKEQLSKITGYPMTRGALCAFRRKELCSIEELCRDAERIVVLEAVMNPTNLGAIFRSAAALHMDAVLLTPGSSDPFYRRAARVSMGTVFQIPWTAMDVKKESWPEEGIAKLHSLGFKTVSMALRRDSVEIDDRTLHSEKKLAIIMGTEAFGLSDETLEKSDYTVKIPMSHGVDSLNVAAASAIAFWELGKRL
ncbi:MAG: RNA methyltransferase [Eubacteriales bacterium]|nr:RNA methyltransferase [Eubacteriales bacterium]